MESRRRSSLAVRLVSAPVEPVVVGEREEALDDSFVRAGGLEFAHVQMERGPRYHPGCGESALGFQIATEKV